MQIMQLKSATISVISKNDISAEHHNRSKDYGVVELAIEVNLKKVSWFLSDHGILANV